MAIDLSQYRNLDPQNIGSWPLPARVATILFICVAVLAAGLWFDTKGQWERLEKTRQVEGRLKQEFEKKQAKAANLEAYKKQMEEMEESFGTMLRQLPSKTEVADLLVDITQTGLAAGLEFELFRPQKEQPQEFYAELPIQIRVVGDYHEFGTFVSGVAALPRIVTLHNIVIRDAGKGSDENGPLVMEAVARTYRYLEEEEIAARAAEAKKSSRGRR